MLALISILTFLLLARAFRSLILPLKAVLLNLLSVAAAWGLIVLVWQKGFGSDELFGIEATQAINVEMPIVIFAFLFGVSMDYQVFIISRMREAYDRTRSTETAVVEGIGRTGRLVTSAALILGLAFVAFGAQPSTEAKIFATALGGGILLDATIIRGILAPAVVALLGRWNWWLPGWAARILRVQPSPVQPEATHEPAPQPVSVSSRSAERAAARAAALTACFSRSTRVCAAAYCRARRAARRAIRLVRLQSTMPRQKFLPQRFVAKEDNVLWSLYGA
jgi:putative drug exporter of the RND superfamily